MAVIMKILAFGDIHEDTPKIREIDGISSASCIIVSGDLTNVGGVEKAKTVIDSIRRYNPNVYAQAGNFDRKEVETFLAGQGISLHGNGFILEDIGIFGVGGSNKTPFNTPNEFCENDIEALIYAGYRKIMYTPLKLFVSHAPPFNTKADIIKSGEHVGSKSVRRFIETCQPDVCIAGHIHEAKGEDWIGRTIILNPGMLKNGGYVEIVKEDGLLKAALKI
ncbi:metallophosphoesterase [bacterium]|nr:metallophosphoesterase [bacterium]